jgi:predicted ferric reductase
VEDIDHTYWYLTRASGLVAYLLMFATVALGLLLTSGLIERPASAWLREAFRRYRVYDLHRFLSIFTLVLTAFHVFIVLPDAFIRFTVWELLVPFASPYRPLFMALGAFALYLAAIVVASFYFRRLVSYRAWRTLHYATLAVFALALAHAAGAGTDTEAAWARYIYSATGFTAFALVLYRAIYGTARRGRAVEAADSFRRGLPFRSSAEQAGG